MASPELSDRERRVLEAVIQSYVETAEPAGSRTISKRFGLGVSPATIRNTMSDLEEKGYLYHPHTSAGRIPTDIAYRLYVDTLMRAQVVPRADADRISEHLSQSGASAIEAILRKAAQSLSIVTQELGVALGPRLDNAVLQRLELIRVSNERLLLMLTLGGGAVRTIFVEVDGQIAESAVAEVMVVLNERLAGLSLRTIRATLGERLRDSSTTAGVSELLNVFVQEGETLFDVAGAGDDDGVVLGQASVLAEQPEFSSGDGMRRLLALTETRAQLGQLLRGRSASPGISITIGNEHGDPRLESFTIVTAEYRVGSLNGVIGVIGPTRMPYDKVIALVRHTSLLVSDILH
ncbi:MAG: heat-inducible transcription repressor HrcA [Gemmatimonadetes bacterium]|mgnify:CR=1 FL=1|jgi:heat-inducible transcriptional repressor|nr:heat-inducible transcription repressor HrcA [Gemmatimonadota bacterium]MBP9105535.1 heat-inducible transcription repressor HrcA [Gemmatimonadaceae bacterium]MBK6455652.1 heat-inducible transcription repressor HrcA [Gemmatimonadota bacterium]MBK6841824.1 heat-inducible transcription repressor HrcA [Gemmatimonadota bacterium]MBK7835526.1 heat-inducible transcription repressor HrcA [Gemmatimonadota bacterium]